MGGGLIFDAYTLTSECTCNEFEFITAFFSFVEC